MSQNIDGACDVRLKTSADLTTRIEFCDGDMHGVDVMERAGGRLEYGIAGGGRPFRLDGARLLSGGLTIPFPA